MGWSTTEPSGTIFTWTKVWHAAHEALDTAVPYIIVVVELESAGGSRLVGNLLVDDVETIDIELGAPVRGEFVDHCVDGKNYTLLQWRLVGN
ncbi:Zn-ribbon domain-containing OB-fold protein [Rhodococcus sp. OK302]|uniref:Zn-ribbon domain-containing OB-fold protein n=1 Tax=Rhodococcus sp. OK302 TaxID=1882769 RepID=UPI0020CCBA56|nr:OB-fold domain-containing protein [Rhodococcus sp. OK302]